MFSLDKLNRIGVFMATGYICAGTAIAVIGGIPLWTEYFDSTFLLVSAVIICTVIVAGACGILLMRYLIKKVGAKTFSANFKSTFSCRKYEKLKPKFKSNGGMNVCSDSFKKSVP